MELFALTGKTAVATGTGRGIFPNPAYQTSKGVTLPVDSGYLAR
jgi:hypothetical protein